MNNEEKDPEAADYIHKYLLKHQQEATDIPYLVNDKGAAKITGMSESFLRKSRCEGQIANRTPGPPYIKIGRAVRYRISDLDRWLEEHRRG